MHNISDRSLAAEVAINRTPQGLQHNHQWRLARLQQTRQHHAFISVDESCLTGEMPRGCAPEAPLFGLLFSCKDNINVQGFATSAGTPGLADFHPAQDAPLVARLRALGAQPIGKNNMHELSFGVTSVNAHWGTVENPRHPGFLAGGSSGGSAAAVAAGAVAFSVGTDTGGSVRIPAALCGVCGFRPTTGRYPRDGIVPVSHTKDTPGFIAARVEDIALLDAAVMGESVAAPQLPARIGIPERFLWQGIDASVAQTCQRAVTMLEQQGVEIVRFDDAHLGDMNASVQFPVPFYEFFVDFPRFLLSEGLEWRFSHILSQLSDSQVSKILHTQLSQCTVSWDDYMAGLCTIGDLRAAWQETFAHYQLDALLYPTVSCAVPPLSAACDHAVFEQLVRNTDMASSVGAPSLTLPVARAGEFATGLSLDGLPGYDRRLLQHASAIAAVLRC